MYNLIVILFFFTFSFAQSQIKDFIKMQEVKKEWLIQKEKPIKYDYVNDRDVLWSKIVYEYIDLSKEVNHPFGNINSTNNSQVNSYSLYDVILNAINNDQLHFIYKDNFFNTKLTKKALQNRIISYDTIPLEFDYGVFNKCIVRDIKETKITSKYIKGYKIKGMYYFDKHFSELRYRIIALAPISISIDHLKLECNKKIQDDLVDLFWVHYPTIRNFLHQEIVFKSNNFDISYDMLLTTKRYDSIIYMEEKDYYTSTILENKYLNVYSTLEKSNRIKDEIRSFELTMWNN